MTIVVSGVGERSGVVGHGSGVDQRGGVVAMGQRGGVVPVGVVARRGVAFVVAHDALRRHGVSVVACVGRSQEGAESYDLEEKI